MLEQNDIQGSQAAFAEALRSARRRQMKVYELRAATDLARLWGEQGRREEARELLAPLYGWFTEGFDTADLKKAAMLLGRIVVSGQGSQKGHFGWFPPRRRNARYLFGKPTFPGKAATGRMRRNRTPKNFAP